MEQSTENLPVGVGVKSPTGFTHKKEPEETLEPTRSSEEEEKAGRKSREAKLDERLEAIKKTAKSPEERRLKFLEVFAKYETEDTRIRDQVDFPIAMLGICKGKILNAICGTLKRKEIGPFLKDTFPHISSSCIKNWRRMAKRDDAYPFAYLGEVRILELIKLTPGKKGGKIPDFLGANPRLSLPCWG